MCVNQRVVLRDFARIMEQFNRKTSAAGKRNKGL